MKAIPARIAALALPLMLGLVAGCSERAVEPTPLPSPTPTPTPPPRPAPQVDWQHAPATPGDWAWSMESGKSVARFADGVFAMRCDARGGTVTLLRSGRSQGPVPATVQTRATTRQLKVAPAGENHLAVSLPARDPLLDAMAFSRGHFSFEVAGLETLYVPSWPEVSRVIEDCR